MAAVPGAAGRRDDPAAWLQRADIWRGDSVPAPDAATVASGFATLDALLPGGGWPQGALTELLPAQPGIGEIALLEPVLTAVSGAGGWIALVAPPLPLYAPYAPAWAQMGIELRRLLIVEASGAQALWACEQILAAGAFAASLSWLPEAEMRALRRLQLAQQGQRSCAFVFRAAACAAQSSPAPLRLQLAAHDDMLAVHVLKRRGPPLAGPLLLPVRRPLYTDHAHHPTRSPVAGAALPAAAAGSVSVA